MGKNKDYKRTRLRPDRPLELEVCVEAEAPTPAVAPWASRPLVFLMGWIPTYRDTGPGRDRVKIWRSALILTAVAVAWKGGVAWLPLVFTAMLALAAATVPVPHDRRQRWLRWARGLALPGVELRQVAGQLHCDGTKITIRHGGRVWGSLRPAATDSEVVVGSVGPDVYLGFCPATGKKRDALWFVGARAGLPADLVVEALPSRVQERLWRPVRVDGEGWGRLFEAFSHPRFLEVRS